MRNAPIFALLALAAAAGGVAFVALRRRGAEGGAASPVDDGSSGGESPFDWGAWNLPSIEFGSLGGDLLDDAVNAAYSAVGAWRDPPAELAPLIAAAEDSNGIPRNLLARQLWQESRYNAAAVNARTGAQGIAQIMPATARDPGFGVPPIADPFNAPAAIAWAGRYMHAMYAYTGSWALALAAYNWGAGNVKHHSQAAWPTETQNYVAQILGDTGYA
ncbi:MAG TPA: lytic transglycosylase domain-containing protein [Solimonas sp.]|nr:lytic transglycosylase domain-containing protein [Solimonas sp.]